MICSESCSLLPLSARPLLSKEARIACTMGFNSEKIVPAVLLQDGAGEAAAAAGGGEEGMARVD